MSRSTVPANLAALLLVFACSSDDAPSNGAAGSSGSSGASGSSGSAGAATTGGSGGAGAAGAAAGGAGTSGGGIGGASGGAAGASGASGASGTMNAGGEGNMTPTKLPGRPILYVGGFGGDPLRVYDVDKTTAVLSERQATHTAGPSPSYLALDPTRTHLYVANEDDGSNGGLTAFSILADGSLELINHQTGSDGGFTHLAVAPGGQFVIGASYNGGSVSVFPIEPGGGLGAQANVVDFGNGSQAHAVAYDGGGTYVWVPTKGADAVQQLLLGETGQLTPNAPPSVASANGAGPRHIALHPSGALAFVINELSSTVTSYTVADGKLTAGASVSSLPQGYNGNNTGAHVEVSPDGRFVYASNRGHDSIAVFSVNEQTGDLQLLEHEPTGNTPRDFDVDPNGELLIAANQDDDTLSVYRIEASGQLTALGSPVSTRSQPCSLQFHYIE